MNEYTIIPIALPVSVLKRGMFSKLENELIIYFIHRNCNIILLKYKAIQKKTADWGVFGFIF